MESVMSLALKAVPIACILFFLSCVDRVQLTQYSQEELLKARRLSDTVLQLMTEGDLPAIYGLYNENFRKKMSLEKFRVQYEKTVVPQGRLDLFVYHEYRVGAKYYFGKMGLKRAFVFAYRKLNSRPAAFLNIEIASDSGYRALSGIHFSIETNTP